MPKIAYREINFKPATLALIGQVNTIIANYRAQGFTLTLRQAYYQCVTRNIIANKDTEYKRLGSIVNDARLAGLIDWDAIVDRTRAMRSVNHWASPEEIIGAVAAQYRVDKWADQPCHLECWIEKDALIGVIEGVCRDLDIPHFSCRGYVSQSEMWAASQRLLRCHDENNQRLVILHLGDHDPSGLDMTRDIRDRLTEFVYHETTNADIEVRRIALNMDQIDQYGPPPNPAKLTDARAEGYIAEYGESSWELDALEPVVLAQLIEDTVAEYRDDDIYGMREEHEGRERALLGHTSRRWSEVARMMEAS